MYKHINIIWEFDPGLNTGWLEINTGTLTRITHSQKVKIGRGKKP